MNDHDNPELETRSRAAARAIYDAVERPASTAAGAAPRSRGPIRAVAVAAVVTLIAVVGTTAIVNRRADAPASEVTNFCAQIEASASQPVTTVTNESTGKTTTDRNAHPDGYLLDAPPEIYDVAARVYAANAQNRPPDTGDSTKLFNWFEIHCFPDAAQPDAAPNQQRYAPLPTPADVTICTAANQFPSPAVQLRSMKRFGEITIYGDTAFPDPYRFPMIGVATSREEQFVDDDSARPIALTGRPDAVISTMTGSFSIRLEGSQTISWSSGRQRIAVLGRGYGPDRTAELAAIAEQVTVDGAGPRVSLVALPVDFQARFHGPLMSVFGATPFSLGTYSLSGNGASLQISGAQIESGEADAIRFVAPELAPTTIGGQAVLSGSLAPANNRGTGSPTLTRWSVQEGLYVTILSLPSPSHAQPSLETLVRNTRRLNRAEWEDLINQSKGCFSDLVSSRTASGSGSAQSSATSSPGTTATTSGPAGP